jgi:DNA-binding response OmpR family regulator
MSDLLFASDRVEDQLDLLRGLEAAGFRPRIRSVNEAAIEKDLPDAIVIDAVKDFFAGRDAVRAVRAADERVAIVAIVSSDHLDGVGPDWGLSSFCVDPVTPMELGVRVSLLIADMPERSTSNEQLRVGDLSIDPESYQVRLRGQPLDLTYKEFQLLSFLANRPGRVWTRQQLLQEVWGYDFFGGTRTVDVHVRRLRAKLGPEHEAMIGTIRNVGYKLEAKGR